MEFSKYTARGYGHTPSKQIHREGMLSLRKKPENKTLRTGTGYRIISLLLCAFLLLPLCGCVKKDEAFKKQIFAMDTVMTLTAYGRNGDAGLEAAENTINSLNAMLDPERTDSIVYALNSAQGETTPVSDEITEMIDIAKTVYDRTGGALDLTIYPLVKLWGFIDSNYYVPTEEEREAELQNLCFDDVVVDGTAGNYTVTMPSFAQISFGASAKGCTSDEAIAAMREAGVQSGIMSLGGNVQTLGTKPDGSNWNVAIQDPDDTGDYAGILSVGETAVITSGNYQRYFIQDGVLYHHIIDPATGAPSESGLKSATIVCESGAMADCLSTAMFVLGEEKALEYWRTYGGFELILITDDNRVICTSGLSESFTLAKDTYSLEFTD
ncbi:MAG: FAD:protein FMN transferase [Clostridia bacterium]|nr:FAD:protein FMN transferase [Clostridia bacterium]NCC68598.1 FAD:protein FMN transferase [Clostridia bacterium]